MIDALQHAGLGFARRIDADFDRRRFHPQHAGRFAEILLESQSCRPGGRGGRGP